MDKCGIGRLTRTECGPISVKDTEVSELNRLISVNMTFTNAEALRG